VRRHHHLEDRRSAVLGRRRNHERGGPAAEGFADRDPPLAFELCHELGHRVEPLRTRATLGVRATYDVLGHVERSAHRGILRTRRSMSSAISCER
jgi:hypothetical protein